MKWICFVLDEKCLPFGPNATNDSTKNVANWKKVRKKNQSLAWMNLNLWAWFKQKQQTILHIRMNLAMMLGNDGLHKIESKQLNGLSPIGKSKYRKSWINLVKHSSIHTNRHRKSFWHRIESKIATWFAGSSFVEDRI